jgi:hypothetical protein
VIPCGRIIFKIGLNDELMVNLTQIIQPGKILAVLVLLLGENFRPTKVPSFAPCLGGARNSISGGLSFLIISSIHDPIRNADAPFKSHLRVASL